VKVDTGNFLVIPKTSVDFIFFCVNGLNDILNSVSGSDIHSLGGFAQVSTIIMENLEVAGFGHLLNIIIGSKHNFSFTEGRSQWNFTLSSEVVDCNLMLKELISLLSDHVEVSQVSLTIDVGLWESQLALDLIRNKRQLLRSVVLNSTWGWNIKIMS
jgi:hypothetical protein